MRQTLIALFAALVIAGCSGGNDDSTPMASLTAQLPAATSTTTATAPVTTASPLPTTTEALPDPPPPTTASAPVSAASVRSVTVGGIGAEYTQPERCIVELSVSSRGSTVVEASKVASGSGETIRTALIEAGVASSDIQTSHLRIHPFYDDYPVISGYEMEIGYRVTMRDLDNLGSALADSIAAGGDDVRASSLRFEAENAGLMGPARAAAWADAETRGQELAALAGESLGAVLDVHEKVLITSPHGMVQGGEGDSASFDIPVSPGVTGVTVLLTVTFAIGN